jgi:hypothetical protein
LVADGTIAVHCFGCGAGGDVLSLIAAACELDLRRDFRKILLIGAELAGMFAGQTPAPPGGTINGGPIGRPPKAEVSALWAASGRVDQFRTPLQEADRAVARFFAHYRWWPPLVAALDLARLTPPRPAYHWPRWWPARWAEVWRVALQALEPDGTPASLHARAVFGRPLPKTRWPMGCDARGLFFADANGRALLDGRPRRDLKGALLLEGATDFVSAAVEVAESGQPFAVLGGTAGSFPALARVRWPEGLPAFVLTDNDMAGDRYAAEIRAALSHADVRRLRSLELWAAR